jgi:hypothetical protein
LDESSTSCFVLSGSEPNLLNRGLSPNTLDESSSSCFVLSGSEPNKVIGDSPLFEKFSSDTDMEVDDLSKIGDNSPPLKFLDVVGRQVMRSDGVLTYLGARNSYPIQQY